MTYRPSRRDVVVLAEVSHGPVVGTRAPSNPTGLADEFTPVFDIDGNGHRQRRLVAIYNDVNPQGQSGPAMYWVFNPSPYCVVEQRHQYDHLDDCQPRQSHTDGEGRVRRDPSVRDDGFAVQRYLRDDGGTPYARYVTEGHYIPPPGTSQYQPSSGRSNRSTRSIASAMSVMRYDSVPYRYDVEGPGVNTLVGHASDSSWTFVDDDWSMLNGSAYYPGVDELSDYLEGEETIM